MDVWRDRSSAPRMPVGRTGKLYSRFREHFRGMEGRTTPEMRTRIVEWVRRRLGGGDARAALVQSLLFSRMGDELGDEWIFKTGRWICSLLSQPEEQVFQNRWDGCRGIWSVVFVDDIVRAPERTPVYNTRLHMLEGPAAGTVLHCGLGPSLVAGMLRRCGWRTEVYRDPLPVELGGLLFSAWVRRNTYGSIAFEQVHVQPSHRTANRRILQDREGPCTGPAGADRCGYCRFGRDACPLSMHASTYPLAVCGNTSVFHQGPCSGGWCINCLEKGIIYGKVENKKTEESGKRA